MCQSSTSAQMAILSGVDYFQWHLSYTKVQNKRSTMFIIFLEKDGFLKNDCNTEIKQENYYPDLEI